MQLVCMHINDEQSQHKQTKGKIVGGGGGGKESLKEEMIGG